MSVLFRLEARPKTGASPARASEEMRGLESEISEMLAAVMPDPASIDVLSVSSDTKQVDQIFEVWRAGGEAIAPAAVEPLAAGLFDLGEGWDLLVETTGSNVSGSAFSAGLWDGTDQVAYAEDQTPAYAILALLFITTETGGTLPGDKLADLASRAAREIALSLAAPPAAPSDEAPTTPPTESEEAR